MDEQIKRNWIKDLTSGIYIQTTGALKRNYHDGRGPCFCVMGVLCDQYVKETGNQWETNSTGEYFSLLGSGASLPLPVVTWARLETTNPFVKMDGICTTVMGLNDSKGWKFKRIAKAVEANF